MLRRVLLVFRRSDNPFWKIYIPWTFPWFVERPFWSAQRVGIPLNRRICFSPRSIGSLGKSLIDIYQWETSPFGTADLAIPFPVSRVITTKLAVWVLATRLKTLGAKSKYWSPCIQIDLLKPKHRSGNTFIVMSHFALCGQRTRIMGSNREQLFLVRSPNSIYHSSCLSPISTTFDSVPRMNGC